MNMFFQIDTERKRDGFFQQETKDRSQNRWSSRWGISLKCMAFSPIPNSQHPPHFTHPAPPCHQQLTRPEASNQAEASNARVDTKIRLTWEKLKTIPSKSNHLFDGTHFQILYQTSNKIAKATRTILSFCPSGFTIFLWTTQWSPKSASISTVRFPSSTWELGGYNDSGDCSESQFWEFTLVLLLSSECNLLET